MSRLTAGQKASISFAKRFGNDMVAALNNKPIFFSVMLTIASTESGFGRSFSARNRNNFFGIMKSKWEQRTFASPQQCFEYWVELLTTRSWYVNARVTTAKTPEEQIKAMARGGYYSANNDTKSTLPPNLQAKYGRVSNQESADWYYKKNKQKLDVILEVLPIGKISNQNYASYSQLIQNVNV